MYTETFHAHPVERRQVISPPKATAEISDGVPFGGETTYHHDYPGHNPSPRKPPPPPAQALPPSVALPDGFLTCHNSDFPAHAIVAPCPAARLPQPPPPGAPAWEKDERGKDHVLWDAEAKKWAT